MLGRPRLLLRLAFAASSSRLTASRSFAFFCSSSGGIGGATREVTEDEMLELEREAFVSLCGEPKSAERMQYMLMNNKPLRN